MLRELNYVCFFFQETDVLIQSSLKPKSNLFKQNKFLHFVDFDGENLYGFIKFVFKNNTIKTSYAIQPSNVN